MKRFLIYTVLIVLMAMFLGCEAQNPVCTDNFCFVGEAFPRSELEAGQEFSEVNIDDSVIFATLITGTTPIETTPVVETPQPDTATFADIIADAGAGGTKYVDKTVTITAPVQFVLTTSVSLFTNNKPVRFFIRVGDNLDIFQEGRTYQFDVHVTNIRPPNEISDNYAVWSDLDETKIPKTVPPINVDIKDVIDDVATGGTQYLGKTIKMRATVSFQIDNFIVISIVTNNPKVDWSITYLPDPNDPADKSRLNPYKIGNSHTFTVLIEGIEPPDFENNKYRIRSRFVEGI